MAFQGADMLDVCVQPTGIELGSQGAFGLRWFPCLKLLTPDGSVAIYMSRLQAERIVNLLQAELQDQEVTSAS